MILIKFLLILIVAIALPSNNKNIRSILYVRISSIIFIYAGALALNAFYIQSIGSGIGVYSGLFQVTILSHSFDELDVQNLGITSLFLNSNKNNKTLRKRIWSGIKDGWNIPTLPEHISKLDNNLFVKIFKFIGGLSVFIIVSGIGSQLNRIFFLIYNYYFSHVYLL